MLFDKIVEELFPEVLNAMEDDPLKELLRAARGDDWHTFPETQHSLPVYGA